MRYKRPFLDDGDIIAGGKALMYTILFLLLGLFGSLSTGKSFSYGLLLPLGLIMGIGMFTFGMFNAFYNSRKIINKRFWQ